MNASGFIVFKFFAANDINYRLLRDIGLTNHISKKKLMKFYEKKFSYIMVDIHPNRIHSSFNTLRSNIFEENFLIFRNMEEYVAVPKAYF